MGTRGGCAPSVRSRSPPDLEPRCVDDASRSGHELKRACADSNGDLARRAAPQRTLNRQSSSQDFRTTARIFAAVMGNGTIVTRSGPVTCGEPNPVLTSAFGGVVVEGGGESFDAAGSSVVALDAGAMSTVFESAVGGSVEAVGGSVEAVGEVSVEAVGEVSVEAVGEVSGEAVRRRCLSKRSAGQSGGGRRVWRGGRRVRRSRLGVRYDGWRLRRSGRRIRRRGRGVRRNRPGGSSRRPEAGAGSSARAVPTNAEAATEAATRASNNPRGLSDRRRRLGIRLLRTTTHLPS